ncbi:hypothetical protein TcasGA2_TC005647 [Tribolium castaneum]|uniref:Uncharacterized protein n=1 Tax=Tribolium castaneum TaxID=7070 RepID=D6WX29_TRICA|nr:hypothetical protein TcasGA2_TC005647 [Tribolium castaneum]
MSTTTNPTSKKPRNRKNPMIYLFLTRFTSIEPPPNPPPSIPLDKSPIKMINDRPRKPPPTALQSQMMSHDNNKHKFNYFSTDSIMLLPAWLQATCHTALIGTASSFTTSFCHLSGRRKRISDVIITSQFRFYLRFLFSSRFPCSRSSPTLSLLKSRPIANYLTSESVKRTFMLASWRYQRPFRHRDQSTLDVIDGDQSLNAIPIFIFVRKTFNSLIADVKSFFIGGFNVLFVNNG